MKNIGLRAASAMVLEARREHGAGPVLDVALETLEEALENDRARVARSVARTRQKQRKEKK